MIYGTHNSGTGGKLVWWLRPIGGIINLTSKCQNKSINEQLANGVRLFNLQIAYVNGEWRFTHGLAVYKENFITIIRLMKSYATKANPIYFQLYYDRCFWCKQRTDKFIELIDLLRHNYLEDDVFMMFSPLIESTKEVFQLGNVYKPISSVEHYWTLSWSKHQNKLIDKLPLPKYHAKKYNKQYKDTCKHDYLMLDFYNI